MHVLTVNSGSSSVKFALYDLAAGETPVFAGILERIGLPAGHFTVGDATGATLLDEQRELPDVDAALNSLLTWLRRASIPPIDGVGHRIVHGGVRHRRPELITPELVADLRALIPLAQVHLPAELDTIAAFARVYPSVPQVACFDTAFHRSRPHVAQLYALPLRFEDEGVVRYGFHGLSLEYILQELARLAGTEVAAGRVVVAHLGNGSSMTAIRNGESMDATMGFTPLGGLMMSTRTGDLDPGVPLYLLEAKGLSPADLRTLVSAESGLLGVSGVSSDMRDLLERERDDPRAALAVALFCYTARKFLGALAAVLGGIETLVFTAGIGEHSAPVRERICDGLGFLGIQLDPARNAASAPIISTPASAVTVRVMKTNEELMIARHTAALLRETRDAGSAGSSRAP